VDDITKIREALYRHHKRIEELESALRYLIEPGYGNEVENSDYRRASTILHKRWNIEASEHETIRMDRS
jgi:translation initiation factor 2 alpha subunit (eIF-2alpha)